MNYEEAMTVSLMKIGALRSGTEFGIKDLFEGVVWNGLERGEKLNIGRGFKNRVTNGQVPNVVYMGKQANNSALYRKE